MNNPDYNWLWGDGDWAAWTRFSGWVVSENWDRYFKAGNFTSCHPTFLTGSSIWLMPHMLLVVLHQTWCLTAIFVHCCAVPSCQMSGNPLWVQ